ncbi:MAG: XdhC family protein [Burkholderiales bacterium]|nr:XdhC family protein [Burkholderiales bacterium]
MYSNAQEVLEQALAWRRSGKRVALLTVLDTFGASPRPPGSMAAVSEDGVVVGSVSGGCVEDDLVRAVGTGEFWQAAAPVAVREYGVNAQDRARFRLPCGSALRVAIESRWASEVVESAMTAIQTRHAIRRSVHFETGVSSLSSADNAPYFAEDERAFHNVLGPRYRLLVIGASELGRYLVNIAQTLDYAVTVCDPRAEYADHWDIAATAVARDMPDDVVNAFGCDDRTAVVAVTHDPKLDDLALMEALKTSAFYIGALGSLATNEKRRERLLGFDLTPEQVARLRGPVGINIGSRTPAEIAVSIAAELVQVRREMERTPRTANASCVADTAS